MLQRFYRLHSVAIVSCHVMAIVTIVVIAPRVNIDHALVVPLATAQSFLIGVWCINGRPQFLIRPAVSTCGVVLLIVATSYSDWKAPFQEHPWDLLRWLSYLSNDPGRLLLQLPILFSSGVLVSFLSRAGRETVTPAQESDALTLARRSHSLTRFRLFDILFAVSIWTVILAILHASQPHSGWWLSLYHELPRLLRHPGWAALALSRGIALVTTASLAWLFATRSRVMWKAVMVLGVTIAVEAIAVAGFLALLAFHWNLLPSFVPDVMEVWLEASDLITLSAVVFISTRMTSNRGKSGEIGVRS